MPPIVTTNDTIICIHGGTVVLTPKQGVVTASGGAWNASIVSDSSTTARSALSGSGRALPRQRRPFWTDYVTKSFGLPTSLFPPATTWKFWRLAERLARSRSTRRASDIGFTGS